MTHDPKEEVRNALRNVREHCGTGALATLFKKFDAIDLLTVDPGDYPAVIATAKKIVTAAGKSFAINDHADDTTPADNVDPFQRQGAANDRDSRQYWSDRRAALAAGEPVPDLPVDRHNQRVLAKLAADTEAAKDLGRK